VDASSTLRHVRQQSRLSLRALAARAHTSHSTLAAYESGRKVPTVETLDRVARAAGYELDVRLSPAIGGADHTARGKELQAALELAALFPARHQPTLSFPPFGR